MIILDTNVVSEPLKPRPEARVLAWLNSQIADTLFLTATNLAELLICMELTPEGKRKRALAAAIDDIVRRLFGSRILPFDHRAAALYASLKSRARSQGVGVSMGDAQIAAVAEVHGFAIATRDQAPFQAMGIDTVNPWVD